LVNSLAEAMFSDVLIALREAAEIEAIVVVSADRNAQLFAAREGAITLDDEERGHNAAAELGVRASVRQGADQVLLVPGDCPMLDPAELNALVARPAPPRSVLIVPDRHGTGTNALLLRPPDALAPSFGPDSCARHLAAATASGAHAEAVDISSLALDVDTPDDLAVLEAAFRATPEAAPQTRGVVNELIRERA
jgi:2-phospho-L-lactate guanylyltransferase